MSYHQTKKALLTATVRDTLGQLDTKRVFLAYRQHHGEALDLTPLSAILAELVRDGVLSADNELARKTGVWTLASGGRYKAEMKLKQLEIEGW